MSSWFRSILLRLGITKQHFQILIIGLDASGKTTIINHINPKSSTSPDDIVPTVGFEPQSFSKNNVNFTVFDMGGAARYRSMWSHYYESSSAIVFVVDSTDRLRLCVAKDELSEVLKHKSIARRPLPLLVLANKNDVKTALSGPEVAQALSLDLIRDKSWTIVSTCALTGAGLEEGFRWLTDRLTSDVFTSPQSSGVVMWGTRRYVLGVVAVAAVGIVAFAWFHQQRKKPVRKVSLGVVGLSSRPIATELARLNLRRFLMNPPEGTEFSSVVSGLTAMGIPLVAYEEATKLGIPTVGIACSKANNMPCFPCQKRVIVGDNWGDESHTFLTSIDMLVLVGEGGKQSNAEFQAFTGPKFHLTL
ncbi:ADP-ribosylation factor family [Pelomyxa schiedti]|nr:ADP-ribosylation factor family [Pelomyxa schiedti]